MKRCSRFQQAALLMGIAWACAVCHGAETPGASYQYRIAYATYFGGSEGEEAREVIPLQDGSVFFGGQTASPDMTVTPGAVQEIYRGEPAGTGHGGVYGGDMFVVHLSADGSRIIASTYLGGSKQERNVYGMALDRNGNIVVSTATRSSDLPTTPGAYQETYGGGPADFVAAKMTPDLTKLLWCTYVGRGDNDWGRGGLTLDPEDNVYLLGSTLSADFPTTPGAYQEQPRGGNDAVVVKLTADGSSLVFATRLGGSKNEDIMGARVDASGNIHVAGHTWSSDFPVVPGAPQSGFGGGESDGFMAGFSSDGTQLLYSTYLGGTGAEFGEHRLALLQDGAVLFTGVTSSSNFPTTAGAYQRNMRGSNGGFLTKLSADHGSFAFSTLLGGSGGEFYLMPTVDDGGNIFIVGSTSSQDFPVTGNALQKTYGGGGTDGVLAVLSGDGSDLLYATYLGGSGDDLIRSVALGSEGHVYLVGKTDSGNFPVTAGAAQTTRGGKMDSFVVRLEPVSSAGTLQFGTSSYSVAEAGGMGTIDVTRTGGTTGTVAVDYATSDGSATAGSDYTSAWGTLTWADGEGGAKTFTVQVTDDALAEGTETVNLTLSGAAGGASLGSPSTAVMLITDDERPGGLVAHWKLDDGAGLAAIDSTGHGHDGQLFGGPAWTGGKHGGALGFDGNDDYVQVPDAPQLDFGSGKEFTVTFWMRGSDTSDVQMLLTKRDNAGYQVWFQPGKGFFLRIDEGPNNVETVASKNPLDGEWHHVAVGRNTIQHFVFIDGALDRLTGDTTLADLTNDMAFDIGNESAFPSVAFHGLIDDLRVYDRGLGPEEIHSIFTSTAVSGMFIRGDIDGNGRMNLADVVVGLLRLFLVPPLRVACDQAVDFNDDGNIVLGDVIAVLLRIFADGAAPAEPYPDCGTDTTPDGLSCNASTEICDATDGGSADR